MRGYVRYLSLALVLACAGTASASTQSRLYVVLGSFSTEAAAERARDTNDYGRRLTIIPAMLEPDRVSWRLASGPFVSHADAQKEKEQLGLMGLSSAWIVDAGEPIEAAAEAVSPGTAETIDALPTDTDTDTDEVPTAVVRDVVGEQTLVKRGIPQDLNRGVLVRVTPESLARFVKQREDTGSPILPEMALPHANQVSQMQEIYLSNVRLRGSDLLSDELQAVFQPYLGRSITTEELLELKNRANMMFVDNGYINSGVLIPDQQVVDGVVVLDTIEGAVSRVDVSGELRSSYVRNRLDTRPPFNLAALQESLKLLEKNPLVDTVKARVLPGDTIGTATLDIAIEAARSRAIGLSVANNRAPSVGAEHGEVYFRSANLFGFGDSLFASSSVTEGLDAYAVEYDVPLNAREHTLVLAYSKTDAKAIEEPFDAIDIDSITESARVGLILPVSRTPNSQLAIEIIAEARRNLTTLLGLPFSFSEGAVDGESRVAPVRLGATYVHQGLYQSFASRVVVSHGTSAFDATKQQIGPEGQEIGPADEFTSVLAQLQYSRQLSDNFHATTKFLAQYASDSLPAIERVALGGMGTVRGYRENQLVRDDVYLLSVEGRYRLPSLPQVHLVTFVDWGRGRNNEFVRKLDYQTVESVSDDLSSVGIGIDVKALRGFSASLYLAHGFEDVIVRGSDLQDDGIHFKLNYEYRF